ncbi:MAG: acetylxylan esterase, partial [Spirochaetales bacterium]|nr:acetylxylan esterase [Spirochaetales bacterium]
MSTKNLDPRKQKALQPAFELWKSYNPGKAEFGFRSATVSEAKKWQSRTRSVLNKVIGFQESVHSPKAARVELVDKGFYTREKIVLSTSDFTRMPVYLLVPKDLQAPPPVVVAFHGHGYGVKDILGLWEDGEERESPDGYHKDFAIDLCRRGFAVAAPEISCFGERQTDFSYLDSLGGQEEPTTCAHTAALATHMGGSVIGLRVRDGKRLIDYLLKREDIDAKRLGAMGISGGGLHTFFSTCLDTRIQACVVSGYFCTFRDSILAMFHCPCNFVPGLSRFGEMADLAGLIAPRPMLIESADHDPVFPQSK